MATAAQKPAHHGELMTAAQRKEVEEFRKAARAYTKKFAHSRKAALQSLIDAGFLTPKGNPRRKYS